MDLFKKILSFPFVLIFMVSMLAAVGAYFVGRLVRTFSWNETKKDLDTFLENIHP